LREALTRDAQYRDAGFALGQSLAAAGDAAEARRRFATLLEDRPDDPAALAEYARTAWELGQRDNALAAYERALAGEPMSATLHLNRGATLASLGRFTEAFEAGLEAARFDPDSAETWQFLVNAAREAGLPEHAREAEWILRSLTAPRRGG